MAKKSAIGPAKIRGCPRAILLHTFGSEPDAAFFPWLRRELETHGVAVEVPALPDPDAPDFEARLGVLTALRPDEKTLVVGRSLGATLGFAALSRGVKFGKFVSVCGAARYEKIWGFPSVEKFFQKCGDFDFEKIRENAGEISVFFGPDDPLVTPIAHADFFAKNLGIGAVAVPGAGHFTGEKYPEILAAAG